MAKQISRTDRARHLFERQADVALRRNERRYLPLGANRIRKPANRDHDDNSKEPDRNEHFYDGESFFCAHGCGCQL